VARDQRTNGVVRCSQLSWHIYGDYYVHYVIICSYLAYTKFRNFKITSCILATIFPSPGLNRGRGDVK
jgi:hypothetical protein